MLTIRLQRAGKRNRPEYRLVLAEKTAASQKKFVEVLGSYNPHSKNLVLKNEERLQYWMGQHAEISPTVHNLLVSKQIVSDKKVKSFTIPKKEVVAEPEAPAAQATPEVAEVTSEQTAAPEAPAEVPTETPAEVPTETSPAPETPVEPTAEPAPTEEPQA